MAKVTYNAGFYAQAIFQIALEHSELDTWQEDLSLLTDLGNDAVVVDTLEDTAIDFDDKVRIVSGLASEIHPRAINLIYLLIVNKDLKQLGSIAAKYRELRYAYEGIEQADVTTAIPLDEETIAKLEERLSSMVGKKLHINLAVDERLIGGFIARIGEKVIDGSTRSRLIALKKQLGTNGHHERSTVPPNKPEAA